MLCKTVPRCHYVLTLHCAFVETGISQSKSGSDMITSSLSAGIGITHSDCNKDHA